jgi:hypothetical protein
MPVTIPIHVKHESLLNTHTLVKCQDVQINLLRNVICQLILNAWYHFVLFIKILSYQCPRHLTSQNEFNHFGLIQMNLHNRESCMTWWKLELFETSTIMANIWEPSSIVRKLLFATTKWLAWAINQVCHAVFLLLIWLTVGTDSTHTYRCTSNLHKTQRAYLHYMQMNLQVCQNLKPLLVSKIKLVFKDRMHAES